MNAPVLSEAQCRAGAVALNPDALRARLAQLPHWQAADGALTREYAFPDYRATIAFVNAVADMAEAQDHHPDMRVGYRRCTLAYATHSAGGALTDNDFICAARADALYAKGQAA